MLFSLGFGKVVCVLVFPAWSSWAVERCEEIGNNIGFLKSKTFIYYSIIQEVKEFNI